MAGGNKRQLLFSCLRSKRRCPLAVRKLATRRVEDSTSSEQSNVERLHAVGRVAGRVYVVQSITPGKLSLDSTEQLASGSHTAVMVIK